MYLKIRTEKSFLNVTGIIFSGIDYRFLSETRIFFSGIEYSFLGRNREEYCKIRQERIFIKPNREVLIEL